MIKKDGRVMKRQKEPGYYYTELYDVKERFISYWHQINEIIKLKPKRVLEIGIGNGFVYRYLKGRKINIITLDFDKNLGPDVAGEVTSLPFLDSSFDVVASYEVLEHLPYEYFCVSLLEMFRVSKSYVILSLPDASKVWRFSIDSSKTECFRLLIPLPRFKRQVHIFDGEHYWELEKAGYSFSKVLNDVKKTGFKVEKTYRIFEHPYHRFLILSKSYYHSHG